MLNLLPLADFTFPPTAVKAAVNYITQPYYFITLAAIAFVLMFVLYKWWTKPAVAGPLFGLFLLGYFGSMGDANFRSIVAKPDNVPITIMVISVTRPPQRYMNFSSVCRTPTLASRKVARNGATRKLAKTSRA